MRWLKHLTAAWEDEKIAALTRVGGMEGLANYGLWWRVLEIVAAHIDGKLTDPAECSVTYPLSRWGTLLGLRGSLVDRALTRLSQDVHSPVTPVSRGVENDSERLVTVERHGSDITVRIPKLLKYRDEYTRKSGHSPETELDTETDVLSLGKKEPKKAHSVHVPNKAAAKNNCKSLPEWIPLDSWGAYLEMRIRIRKPMTDRAKQLAVLELDKLRAQGQDVNAVLNQSVLHSWQGLFAVRNHDPIKRDYSGAARALELFEEQRKTRGPAARPAGGGLPVSTQS